MITSQAFQEYWTLLCERFNKNFSEITIAEYYEALSSKLDDRAFAAACRQSFRQDEFFPSPQRLIDLGVAAMPTKVYALPESYPKAYADMDPKEQAAYREAIATFRKQLETIDPGFAAIGVQIATAAQAPQKPLAQQIAEKQKWLSDKILRAEAISWALEREDVELVTDDQGGVKGFKPRQDSPN